jgi:ketosteroid isomerase-like protein
MTSQETVEAFKRAIEAYNRRDIDAFLEAIDSEVEWHGALQALLESEVTVYRGHEGVRQWVRDIDEALADIRLELPEIRDLGDRIVAIGWLRARGQASGAETESPFGCVVEWRNGRATRLLSFLSQAEALEAAGLKE